MVLAWVAERCSYLYLPNLVAFLVMALFSLIIHYKNGYLETKGVIFIVISGVIFSLLGALAAGFLPSRILRIAFGVFLCVLSIFQAIKAIKIKRN